MEYKKMNQKENEEFVERLELVMPRVKEIAEAPELSEAMNAFFKEMGAYLLLIEEVTKEGLDGSFLTMSLEDAKKRNTQLYANLEKDKYETSFLNPTYAVAQLGDYGKYLTAIFAASAQSVFPEIYSFLFQHGLPAAEGKIGHLCIFAELYVEIYNALMDEDCTVETIHDIYYWFRHDYTEIFMGEHVRGLVEYEYDYAMDIVKNADLSNERYLYNYGLNITRNEIEMSAFLNTLSQEEIDAMAKTFTEGYRIGFEVGGKDLSKKKSAELRYPVGMERVVRSAVKNFEDLNLKVVLAPASTVKNKQALFDHKEDKGLVYDKSFVERELEVIRTTFEQYKDKANGYAGPAVTEVFGETPFAPEARPANISLDEKQQQLAVYRANEYMRTYYKYIKGEERSFTIIAYPVPEIGDNFKEIFAETVKLNTLDYVLYQTMQQKIIDVLDTGDHVHILGANGNKTDLTVNLYKLDDPSKQSIFENCVADVNIPVGEVFTSPVLTGTNGKLHVSQVYLREYKYINLELDFEDGKIVSYTCDNFETEEENKKFIADNLLYHHDTLPIGEFAIGTNTTAYRMGREYDIQDKLPILIAEKTGPHFAVGDTCYANAEDTPVYNPDGKEIVARDNEVSLLRKEDPAKAYYNCHTDITIPYDELDKITVVRNDGTQVDVISGGRFVVPGTEKLNEPLDAMEK